MRKHFKRLGGVTAITAIAVVSALAIPAGASAHTGLFAHFNYCPSTNPAVFKCLQSTTTSGKVVLGKKTVPIVNPVVLQGGVSLTNEETFFSEFYGATNGETLSKTPQPVPGGLTGLVNCKEISLSWLRASCEAIFENGLTGVNSTLELAQPASSIKVSESNLAGAEEVALVLPVKVHLENPLLGSGCYIGSSSSPLLWNLTTGTTTPPAGTAPIKGSSGHTTLLEGGLIADIENVKLVDNAWSAPAANGCGGFLVEYILDPIINSSVGVPSPAGKNVAELNNNIYLALASVVNKH